MSWKVRKAQLKERLESGEDALPFLLLAAKDSNRFVRRAAAEGLAARLPDPRAADALADLLEDRSAKVYEFVVGLAPQLGPRAVGAMMRLVDMVWGKSLSDVAEGLALAFERVPDPEAGGAAARALRKRARVWFLPRALRQTLLASAERVEAAIEGVKDLPRAAAQPLDPQSLPLPAEQPPAPAKDLPIPWWRRLF